MWQMRRPGCAPTLRRQTWMLLTLFAVMLCLHSPKTAPQEPITYDLRHLGDPASASILVEDLNTSPVIPRLGQDTWFPVPTGTTRYHDGGEDVLRQKLFELFSAFSRPDTKCLKTVPMGGVFCHNKPDGVKRVCLDPVVYPTAYCLVYSFGVGHDFTFETIMSNFGCDVYAFDSDRFHAKYPTFINDRLTFYKARIGTTFLRQTQFRTDVPGDKGFLVEYWPLSALLRRLGHQRNHLFYLKFDIEGDEWEVFEKSLFQTRILERVQQLALEIHFDDLRGNGTRGSEDDLLRSVSRYLRVAEGLRSRGFLLAQWEPNFKGPELSCLVGLCFHVYSETLWINPDYKRLSASPSDLPPPPHL
ncbi:uncharacterized protein LOC122244347 [Penaeus japonicus]|uniref:uncharacterized protein LOC122244347 n=1 Tax=Penaeus japonicus TaxID=27405 RepID=UPI001C7101BE|nr:uncharacterized protein LOC122244347 [Penaeus japonicus]